MRTTFSFPSSNSPGSRPLWRRHKPPPRVQVAVLASNVDLKGNFGSLSIGAEMRTSPAELDDIYETERRLLYVACTRAREHLLLTGVAPTSEYLADFTSDLG